MLSIVGRVPEIEGLDKIKESSKSEFVAIYGRRRVGKTFLVREYFNYSFDFQFTGLANATTVQQLVNFQISLQQQSLGQFVEAPENWIQAFHYLTLFIESKRDIGRKKVIFLDELPWMDTPHSDFITGLEHFWNSWATTRKDIILVTCGSAASWMLNKLINNRGGLYNRVTERISLQPFNLNETELFLKHKGCVLDRYQILQLYMVMGGIPFYLDAITSEKSAAQNIEELCFKRGALLVSEYRSLFSSLFKKSDLHEKIIEALASKTIGLSRIEIVKLTNTSSGGGLTRTLEELEESGFISKYVPFQKKVRDSYYRLSDFYCSFYHRFIGKNTAFDQGVWINAIDHPSHRAWSGYAFEQICLSHINEIKKALGIQGIYSEASTWRGESDDSKTQIDLLIDRRDRVINICEIKYSTTAYKIDKIYFQNLQNKLRIFREATGTTRSLFLTMITTFGLVRNEYANNIQKSIVMDALFAS